MGRKKKEDSLGVVGVIVAAIIAGVAAIPKEIWIVIGVCVVAYIAYKFYLAINPPDAHEEQALPPSSSSSAIRAPDVPASFARTRRIVQEESYRIPHKPPELPDNVTWIGRNQSVEIGGYKIDVGMLYVGSVMRDLSGYIEPALINPTLAISRLSGNQPGPQLPYWPRYSEISSEARGAYLRWLAGGRTDPHVDVGYLFLFFYGLERRVLVDIVKDSVLKHEIKDILSETRRLLTLYGHQSNSVRSYLSKFISMLELLGVQDKLYAAPLPVLSTQNEVPYYLRVALGQAALDGVPVPAELALAWAECDPTISRRLPVTRCQDAFRRLFLLKYRATHGEGMKLTVNKTKLKLVYVPASAGFRAANEVALKFGGIPDVTLITAPIRKLQELVDASTAPLEQLSRYLGRNPDKKDSLESLLLLPPDLWAAEARAMIESIRHRMGGGMIVLTLKELADLLGGGSVTREKVLGVASALQSMKIGMEPDTLNGAKTPKPADKVILFHMEDGDSDIQQDPEYHLAALKLQLAVAVANSDGDFSAAELSYIVEHISQWSHLPAAHHRRLKAHLRLLRESPLSLATLTKKFAPLDQGSREIVAAFATSIAQRDGELTVPEMKFLEKLNQALGIEASSMYRAVHEGAMQISAKVAPNAAKAVSGVALDAERIAELQRDSERVAKILSDIFVEEAPLAVVEPAPPAVATEPALLGLDAQYARFLQAILARPAWSREELRDVADDLQLMLDGALEKINEAAFDHYDMPCTEGDDPIDVNHEFREKIEQ